MVIKTVNLETVCGITSKLPENTKPEFAFAGKSNVGKSTLINALMNRKSYARTSSTPGKTQNTSKKLEAVFLLVDIRHEPSDNDVMMFDWVLAAGFTPYIVATKSDKIKRSQLAKQTAMIRRTIKEKSKVSHDVSFEMIPFSGTSKAGREDLYNVLDGFLVKDEGVI